ncbi:MAG: glycerophosphodiester phosphodiesterase family protein [Candidatus Izemoplasmatales bacterium]|jgi:glycerophosphoryl diester phosphodiesterase|nr:glycerophosphodiester phosphodiesterase family protein [Candidatus Izemoplasmatales bacterium]
MKDLEWIKTGFIAHRGFHSLDKSIPENSLLAFKKAIDYGYAIELDIHVLKDGNVVVFHDDNLKRVCKKDLELADSTYDEIKHLHLLNTNETIPLLTDVLSLVDGKVPLMIELKPNNNIYKLCEAFMVIIKGYEGKYAVQSFNPNIVNWFRKNAPEIPRGQLAEYFLDNNDMSKFRKFILKRMLLNHISKPDFVNYGLKDMPNKILDKAKKNGLVVIGYTARNILEFQMVKKYYHNSVFEFFRPEEKK